MTQADHDPEQSSRARRLAEAVNDPEASKKLIEMAEEFPPLRRRAGRDALRAFASD